MPRALRTFAGIVALTVLAQTAGAASFSYDATTRVLRLTAAAGEVLHVESSSPGPGSPLYLISASAGGVPAAWTGTNRPGLLAFSVPTSPPGYGLTIEPDVTGGLPLDHIEVIDDTGPVEVTVAGGAQPYADPISVSLANASSIALVHDAEGDPIAFGTASLSVNAPEIRLRSDIVTAGSLRLVSSNPIKLMKPAPVTGLPTLSLTASTLVATSAIVGNATGTANVLSVNGPWQTYTVTNTARIAAPGTTRLLGDLSAAIVVDLGPLEVGGYGIRRTITSPVIDVGSVTGAFSACGGPDVVGMCDVGAQAPASGGEITFDGDVFSTGDWRDLTAVEVTGAAHLTGDINAPIGGMVFRDRLTIGGAATRRITAGMLQTLGGLGQDLAPCASGAISGCAGVGVHIPPVPTTDLVVDALWVNALTAYMPGSITALQPVLTPVTGIRTSTIQSGGRVDLRAGASIAHGGSLTLSGAPTILAGVRPPAAPGSIGTSVDPGPCAPGPLLVIGDWHLTAPIECLSTLTTAQGTSTVSADVTTDAHQGYGGPVVLDLGSGARTLRAGGGSNVAFNGGAVSATWSPATGDVASYTATLTPSGDSCTTPDASTACALGSIAPAPQVTASVRANARAAAPAAGTGTGTGGSGPVTRPLPTGTTTRRRVARGSRTVLTRLIVPPASRGVRTWSERGPCGILRGRLVAPRRPATCTLSLAVARYRRTSAWTGRATVVIR